MVIPSYQHQVARQRRHQAVLTLLHMAHELELYRLAVGSGYPDVSIEALKPTRLGQGYRYVMTARSPHRFIISAQPDEKQRTQLTSEDCKTLWVNQDGQHCW